MLRPGAALGASCLCPFPVRDLGRPGLGSPKCGSLCTILLACAFGISSKPPRLTGNDGSGALPQPLTVVLVSRGPLQAKHFPRVISQPCCEAGAGISPTLQGKKRLSSTLRLKPILFTEPFQTLYDGPTCFPASSPVPVALGSQLLNPSWPLTPLWQGLSTQTSPLLSA